MNEEKTESWSRRLLEVGRTLMADLDQSVVLDRVLETARELTGARYAALGVLNDARTELSRFLTSGIDESAHRAIGDLPRGRGVLGVLIDHPTPLRLADVGESPASYGFPAGHPTMKSFLGVPILIRGEAWGNLYLTEKDTGAFTVDDEEAATILAQWAAIAIENARLYEISQNRRAELEKALRGLEATRDVAVAIGGEIGLEHVLELIVKRGRALVGARSLVIMLREGDALAIHTSAGHARASPGCGCRSTAQPPARSSNGASPSASPMSPRDCGSPRVSSASPTRRPRCSCRCSTAEQGLGILAAFDHGEGGGAFSEDDEQMLKTFAASAATAVALAQSVQSDRLQHPRSRPPTPSADAGPGSFTTRRCRASAACACCSPRRIRSEDPERARSMPCARRSATSSRRSKTCARSSPSCARPRWTSWAWRRQSRRCSTAIATQHGLHVDASIELEPAGGRSRLDADLETAVYRLVQEALTNVAKHAHADSVRVSVGRRTGASRSRCRRRSGLRHLPSRRDGFGLAGMRERVLLAGGSLSIESGEAGTTLRATLPELLAAGARSAGEKAAG